MPKQKPSSRGTGAGEPQAKKARFKSNRNEEEEEEEEDADDSSESFNLSQSPDFTAPFDNREAEYGIIENVSLKNFICHGRLECNLGPNVNFVVGRNGSGKSAILTAIVVGLGGKAIVTNRGNSVKSFIKTGKNVAEIVIKLRNRGDDAYKPNEYGKSIIVERKLRREGGTVYKLKAASGKVISNKREELSHILDHFNIQVDNPVSIMNQDISKTFLHSKNSKDKYKFFLKATQLEQVSNDYKQIVEHKDITEDSVNSQNEKLPDLEKEVLALEQKFKDLTCLKDLKNKKSELYSQLAWALVAEEERVFGSKKTAMQKEESRLPKFDEKIEIQQVKVGEAEERHSQIQSAVLGLRQRLEELSPQHAMASETRQKLKQTAKTLEKEIKQRSAQMHSWESDRDDILARIQEEKARDMAEFEQQRQERERKISTLLDQKKELEAQRQNASREMDQFVNAINGAKERGYGLRSREREIQQTIQACKGRLRNLEGSKKNSLKLYGDNIPELIAAIEQSHKRREFHQKPLGPLGTYLKLGDEQWALGVEVCLKNLLYSFCCHDQHDAGVLKRIMGRVFPRNARQPSIITSKFESQCYNIERNAVDSRDFPSFLDIVTVNNSVIFNTLVDQRMVENILLIERSRDARPYLKNSSPRNCREAFTLEGDQVHAGAEQRFYSSTQRAAKILQGNVEAEIRKTKEELNGAEQAMEELSQEAQSLRQIEVENERLRKRAQQQRGKLGDQIRKINNEVTQLENEGEGEEETNVADLEAEVQQMEAKIKKIQEVVEQRSRSFKTAHQQLQEAQKQYESVDEQFQEISEQVDPLKDDLAQASIEVSTAKLSRKHYEDKKRDLMKTIDELRREADKHEKEVKEAIAKATQINPERLKVTRKAHSIDSEIKQLERRIRKEQDKQGDPDEITRQYNDARKQYDTIKQQIRAMEKFVQSLDSLLKQRYDAFRDMRRFIAQRTKYYFITMMSTRGYNGQLKFDHKNCDLILTVSPGQNSKSGEVSKDVRSLSGGERSFSTVCLIMALWESIESPFRAMDEFDVFMDMMNRKICMELMLQFAKDQAIRQFIFLTPQDMSKIRPSPFLRIHRLRDPERNQGVLTADTEQTQGEEWEDD